MPVTIFASLMIAYAVVQTIVFLLLIRLIDPYEREPLAALAAMTIWGAIGATALSALGNLTARRMLEPDVALVFGRALYAPAVEETAKGIALVIFVVLSVIAAGRFGFPRFEGVTDGIVYGAAIGLGFAFTEDVLYLLQGAAGGALEDGFTTYLARRDFFGLSMLHHAIYSAAFGLGLGLATWARRAVPKVAFPLMGLTVAIVLHAFNNGWVQLRIVQEHGFDAALRHLQHVETDPAVSATARRAVATVEASDLVLVGLFALIVGLWLSHQRSVIRTELTEEARAGLISPTELDLLPRYWRRTAWYWQLMRTGQWERLRLLKRMHNELVDLAFAKRRHRQGRVDKDEIERRRDLISRLKSQKLVFL
jgi:RsiW-degrading membrane proteinase PrsW (M82 family)